MIRLKPVTLAITLGFATLTLAGCSTQASASTSTSTSTCETTRSEHAAAIQHGEDFAGQASSLAEGGAQVIKASPEWEQYASAMRESLALEIPVYARIATATECYSDEDIADAQQRLIALSDNLTRYKN